MLSGIAAHGNQVAGVSRERVVTHPPARSAADGNHFANGGEPLDVVVIDGFLVWCRDIAPLAYPRRDDCALRFASREVAAELVDALTKNDV